MMQVFLGIVNLGASLMVVPACSPDGIVFGNDNEWA